MKRFLPLIPVLLLALYGLQQFHARSLAGARKVAIEAVIAAQDAFDYADSVEAVALAHIARVDTVVIRRAAAQPQRDSVVAAAPDTCGPAIAALQAEVADADSIAAGWQSAYEEEKKAAAALDAAGHTVVDAADDLVDASGGFWQDIIPTVGFGVAAVYDPMLGRLAAGPGITLSWEF
ncbi:MAG: hypothetical protein K0S14_33 [Thermomicrobiales bacterium]|jgi:hypothetical protein|nr:hypothetical protein [Thermomicrobiales bacterium]